MTELESTGPESTGPAAPALPSVTADAAGPDHGDRSAASGGPDDAEGVGLLAAVPTTFAQLPLVPATGDPRVDDAVARLRELEALPVEEHLAVYQDVHHRLHETLADLDVG